MEHWLQWEIDQWVHYEGSIWRSITPWANTLTTELHLSPSSNTHINTHVWPNPLRVCVLRHSNGAYFNKPRSEVGGTLVEAQVLNELLPAEGWQPAAVVPVEVEPGITQVNPLAGFTRTARSFAPRSTLRVKHITLTFRHTIEGRKEDYIALDVW